MSTHEEHAVGDLVLAHTAAQDDHPRFWRLHAQVVDLADVRNDINDEGCRRFI